MGEALKAMEKDTENLERETLRGILMQCTKAQQQNFHRFFPLGISGMSRDKIPMAIQLCERTIKATTTPEPQDGNSDTNSDKVSGLQ